MVKKIPKCPICGGPHYKSFCWQNPKRGYNLRKKYEKAYKTGKVPRGEKTLSKETTKRKRLIMELDKYCSLIVRIGASDKYGVANCFTCGKRVPFKLGDNGHYRSRQAMQTRWDFQNCHFQCTHCNRVLRGNLKKYREHLVKEIGESKVIELETRPPRKISTPELEELLKEMKIKYKELVEEKKKSLYN